MDPDQTEARSAKKIIFGDWPSLSYKGLNDRSPPPLSQGLDPAVISSHYSNLQKENDLLCIFWAFWLKGFLDKKRVWLVVWCSYKQFLKSN